MNFVEWCEQSPIGTAIRGSLWAFPAVETVHLLGLAALGGVVLMLNLRLLGWTLRAVPLATLARAADRWLVGALAVMLASGFVLFTSEAERMYGNNAFRLKMLFLAAAVIFTFTIHRRVLRADETRMNPAWRRATAVVSLLLWTGVALSGRAIGLL
jgi:hypothetical protein